METTSAAVAALAAAAAPAELSVAEPTAPNLPAAKGKSPKAPPPLLLVFRGRLAGGLRSPSSSIGGDCGVADRNPIDSLLLVRFSPQTGGGAVATSMDNLPDRKAAAAASEPWLFAEEDDSELETEGPPGRLSACKATNCRTFAS